MEKYRPVLVTRDEAGLLLNLIRNELTTLRGELKSPNVKKQAVQDDIECLTRIGDILASSINQF